MDIAKQLVRYRTINKISQRELAEKIGVSVITLAHLESGKPVKATTRCLAEMFLEEKQNGSIDKSS